MLRDSNGIIKIAKSRHLGNALIIMTECVVLRDSILNVICIGFSNLEIKGDSKVIHLV